MSDQPQTTNVLSALNAAYREVGFVRKDGQGVAADGSYKFATEAAFIAALRPALIKHGVVFYQSACKVITHEGFTQTVGARQQHVNRVLAEFSFTFQHTVGQDYITVTALGEGADIEGDKAAYKAMTGALKYALRQTFLLETGDEPEASTTAANQVVRTITADQQDAIRKAVGDEKGLVKFLEHNKLEALDDMPATSFDKAMAQIRRSKKKA